MPSCQKHATHKGHLRRQRRRGAVEQYHEMGGWSVPLQTANGCSYANYIPRPPPLCPARAANVVLLLVTYHHQQRRVTIGWLALAAVFPETCWSVTPWSFATFRPSSPPLSSAISPSPQSIPLPPHIPVASAQDSPDWVALILGLSPRPHLLLSSFLTHSVISPLYFECRRHCPSCHISSQRRNVRSVEGVLSVGDSTRLLFRCARHRTCLKMRIGCLQFAPQVGDVDNNLNRADSVLSKANPDDLDLLVLPELAFSGESSWETISIRPLPSRTAIPTSSCADTHTLCVLPNLPRGLTVCRV